MSGWRRVRSLEEDLAVRAHERSQAAPPPPPLAPDEPPVTRPDRTNMPPPIGAELKQKAAADSTPTAPSATLSPVAGSLHADSLWAAPASVAAELTRQIQQITAVGGEATPGPLSLDARGAPPRSPSAAARGAGSSASRVQVAGSLALIGLVGPIEPTPGVLTRYLGGTALSDFRRDFRALVDDPQVQTIVIGVDSPGGRVTGLDETAALIHSARSKKRVIAWTGGDCCSAAYWLASAAHEVVATETAELGSIGVVATYVDTRGAEAKAGVELIEIVSSQSPNKRPDPKEDEGRARYQARVDAVAEVFLADVAKHRGTTPADMQKRGAGGDVLVGRHAVEAGLADRLMHFDALVAELAQGRVK